jgi:hypothetical protein
MIDQQEITWGIVAPPLLMAVGMAAIAQLPLLKRTVYTGVLLAVIFALCQLGFRGWAMPGKDVQDWPAWIALAGGVFTCCSMCHHGPWPWRIVMRLIITGLSVWLLLKPQIESEGTLTVATWVIGGAMIWTTLMVAWERVHTGLAPLITIINPVRHWPEWKRLATTVAILGTLLLPVIIWGVVTSLRATAEPSYGY